MDASHIVENLELALIELEYAAADFTDKKSSESVIELGDLQAMRLRMNAARRALDLAIAILSDRPGEPAQAAVGRG